MNRAEVLDTCEADNLTTALEIFSAYGELKVTHEVNIGMFAIVKPEKGFELGIKWEAITLPAVEKINPKELTEDEENLIKDILKYIGNHTGMTTKFAIYCFGNESGVIRRFNRLADSIFGKCQNGRLTVEEN